jgi:hypothetical protein
MVPALLTTQSRPSTFFLYTYFDLENAASIPGQTGMKRSLRLIPRKPSAFAVMNYF